MLDRDGFRPNVGIVLLNARNQVFWGKRLRTHSWQFPQGGINHGESPEQAMLRELHEEVGLLPEHVQIVARTRDWLRYEVPDHYIRRDARALGTTLGLVSAVLAVVLLLWLGLTQGTVWSWITTAIAVMPAYMVSVPLGSVSADLSSELPAKAESRTRVTATA